MRKIKVKTIYLIAIIVGGLIGLSIKSTYAMFTSSLEIDNPICMSTNLSTSDDIVDTMEVTVQAGETKEVPITINNTSNSLLNYIVFYNSSSTDIETGINLSNSDSNPSVGTINTNTTKKVYIQIKNNSDSNITLTVGVISSSMSTDMNIFINNELNVINTTNLAEYITNLYTTSSKSTATVNSITYNLASSVNLMNDRLGSSSINADSGNIRYYGLTPNNYIYFNCDDYTNQTSDTCEKWRIIGVFDGKVKIMRGSSIGNYSWDGGNANNWATSHAMKLLNSEYESEGVGGSLYWNAGSGSCYTGQNYATTTCDFTSIGLKNDTTRNLISEVTWSLLGYDSSAIYTDVMYNLERTTGSVNTGRNMTWAGEVALPYPSDYGYAADLSSCTSSLSLYSNCSNNNWMKSILGTPNHGWLLNPWKGSSNATHNSAWYVNSLGSISSETVCTTKSINPVLYLASGANIVDTTTGESNNPFQIAV